MGGGRKSLTKDMGTRKTKADNIAIFRIKHEYTPACSPVGQDRLQSTVSKTKNWKTRSRIHDETSTVQLQNTGQ